MIGAVQIACQAEGIAPENGSGSISRSSPKRSPPARRQARGIGSPFGQLAATQLHHLICLGHTRANESKIIEVARIEPPVA